MLVMLMMLFDDPKESVRSSRDTWCCSMMFANMFWYVLISREHSRDTEICWWCSMKCANTKWYSRDVAWHLRDTLIIQKTVAKFARYLIICRWYVGDMLSICSDIARTFANCLIIQKTVAKFANNSRVTVKRARYVDDIDRWSKKQRANFARCADGMSVMLRMFDDVY